MAEDLNPLNLMVTFGVRNDKSRGLLIETLTVPNYEVYFFKYNDQPLVRHCEQMQDIVRTANVVRSKKLQVDLSQFLHEYYRAGDNSIVFRTAKLNSVTHQIEKVYKMRMNKELGAIKRKITMANNKQAKIDEKNQRILTKLKEAEEKFQSERIKRINELMAERLPQTHQVSGNGGGQESQGQGSRQEWPATQEIGHEFEVDVSAGAPSIEDVILLTDDESDIE